MRRRRIQRIDWLLVAEINKTPNSKCYKKLSSNAEKIRFCETQITKIKEVRDNSSRQLEGILASIGIREVEWNEEKKAQLGQCDNYAILNMLVGKSIFGQTIFDYQKNVYNKNGGVVFELIDKYAFITKISYRFFQASSLLTSIFALGCIPAVCTNAICNNASFYRFLILSIVFAFVTYLINLGCLYLLRNYIQSTDDENPLPGIKLKYP